MGKEIKIFISSRFYEFKELREKIKRERFSKLGIGLKLNMLDDRDGIADVRSPAIASIEEASNSDIFILLLGETYKGEIDTKKSYAHQEYEVAIKNNLQILAFPIGDCYNPKKLKLSTDILFKGFQEDVLENSKHITAPFTPSLYDVNEMYDKIYKSLKEYIQLLLEKGLATPYQSIPSQLTSKLGKSTIIGREKELKEINKLLNHSNALLVINGIGGVGKSTIASHYLDSQKNKLDYYGFFEGIESFTTELKEPLNLKAKKLQEVLLEALTKLRKLEGKKLFVFDDIKNIEENQETIDKILSLKNNGYKILFTSREEMKEVENYYLDVLNLHNAKALFNSIYKVKDEALLEEILEYLGYHAFFIEKTAYSIKRTLTPEKIKEKFKNGEFSKISVKRKQSFNKFLNEIFSLDKLDNEEILMLKRFSVLPSIEISIEFLESLFQKKDNAEFENLLDYLSEKGWLIKGHGYKLHQIIKEYLLANHTPSFEEIEIIIDSLNALIKNSINAKVAIKNFKNIIYFESLLALLEKEGMEQEKVGIFLGNLGDIFRFLGFYPKTESLYLKALKIHEKLLGEEHPNTAMNYNNLASFYRSMGMYEKAKPLYIKALKLRKKILGINHPHTATSYNDLALLYESMGMYEKAEPLYLKAIKIREDLLEEEHPNTATSYNNLAELYRSMRKYKKAEILHLKALNICKNFLGEEHPDTAGSYNNLALLYKSMGKYEKVESLYLKAINIWEKLLGKEHPSTATVYNNLAIFYNLQGDYKQAYAYIKMTIEIRSKVLPKKHPHLLNSKEQLSLIDERLRENLLDSPSKLEF